VARFNLKYRQKALELYLKDYTYSEIAKNLTESFGRIVSVQDISYWVRSGKWADRKNTMLTEVNENTVKIISDDLLARSKEQLGAYRDMVAMGLEAITDKTVTVDKVGEAVELIDRGIRGERQINSGLVAFKYIEHVVQIISEEVKDEEVLKRIASRLRRITGEVLSA